MKNRIGVLLGLFSGLFWGLGVALSAYIFFLNSNISPFLVAVVHDFFSIFVLLTVLIIKEKKINFKIFHNVKNFSVVIAALLAGPIGMQSSLYAVKYIGSGLSSSITAVYPAIAMIMSYIFLKQKVTRETLLGILLIIFGIFIHSYSIENFDNLYLGIFFALCCAFAWGSESVLSSYAMKNNLSELEALLIRQTTSFLAYSIIFLFKTDEVIVNDSISIMLFIFVMAIGNMISYIMYYMSINRLETAKATGLNVSYVVWTIVFSYLFLGIQVSIKALIASLIIITGVYMMIRKN